MAIDAGTFVWSVPTNGQTTEAGNAIAGNVTTTGVKACFVAQQPTDVYEVGAIIGTATAATTYAFTVAVDEKIGGTLANGTTPPNSENFCTVTGPAGAAITAGYTLKKPVRFRVPKGGCLVFNVTSAPASGTAQLYAICAVAGGVSSNVPGALVGNLAGAGGVGLTLVGGVPTIVPNEIISST